MSKAGIDAYVSRMPAFAHWMTSLEIEVSPTFSLPFGA
jgi:hypothetical protein